MLGKPYCQKGVLCAGGSDAPVEPVDPLLGIHAAVTRKTPGKLETWNEDQKIYHA